MGLRYLTEQPTESVYLRLVSEYIFFYKRKSNDFILQIKHSTAAGSTYIAFNQSVYCSYKILVGIVH